MQKCPHNNKPGVTTNFDPYKARPIMRMKVLEWEHICWECYEKWGAKLSRELTEELETKIRASFCGYLTPYLGYCFNMQDCVDHAHLLCQKCGKRAVRGCGGSQGGLVCGMPECEDHPHKHWRLPREGWIYRDGPDQVWVVTKVDHKREMVSLLPLDQTGNSAEIDFDSMSDNLIHDKFIRVSVPVDKLILVAEAK